jgi:hypothetical protein
MRIMTKRRYYNSLLLTTPFFLSDITVTGIRCSIQKDTPLAVIHKLPCSIRLLRLFFYLKNLFTYKCTEFDFSYIPQKFYAGIYAGYHK